MRRIGVWGLSIALLAGLTTGRARAADPPWRTVTTKPTQTESSGGWFSAWFGSSGRSADKKPSAAKDSGTSQKADKVAADRAEKARAGAAFLRRIAVCDKLKQIAFDTGNEDLQRMADDLLERAQAAYSQRVARSGSPEDGFESDEKCLEKRLGPDSASSKKPNRETVGDGRTTARKEKP